jgi:hypothetical protein
VATLGELGLMGIPFPEKYGGAGGDPTDGHFARMAGAAPIVRGSGESQRHRTDHGGNRQVNAALPRSLSRSVDITPRLRRIWNANEPRARPSLTDRRPPRHPAGVMKDRIRTAAEDWLTALGRDRSSEHAARATVERAERVASTIRERIRRDEYRYDREADPDRADALLGVLTGNRRKPARAEADVQAAQRELDAVADALAGDAIAVALRSLSDALAGHDTLAVADFNRSLREHFAAVFIGADGMPVPVRKLTVPVTVADEIAALRDADDAVAGTIASHTRELSLVGPDPEHNGEGSQRCGIAAPAVRLARGP